MSAECSKCGTDIVYPAGSWPLGECPVCDKRWSGFDLGELTSLHDGLEVLMSDDPTHPDMVPVRHLAAEIKAVIDAGWSDA